MRMHVCGKPEQFLSLVVLTAITRADAKLDIGLRIYPADLSGPAAKRVSFVLAFKLANTIAQVNKSLRIIRVKLQRSPKHFFSLAEIFHFHELFCLCYISFIKTRAPEIIMKVKVKRN